MNPPITRRAINHLKKNSNKANDEMRNTNTLFINLQNAKCKKLWKYGT